MVSGVLEEGWSFGSAKTEESATTQSGAAMPWMEAARVATNTIMMPALDCFMLPIIQLNRYLHKPAPSVNSNRESNWLVLKTKERDSQELRNERAVRFWIGVQPGV